MDDRLEKIGLARLRLPLDASEQDKHVSILVSKDIVTKRHVVVLFPDRYNEPGIFSYRVIGTEGINIGSMCDFAKAVLQALRGEETSGNRDMERSSPDASFLPSDTGLVIANPSQLIWYRAGLRAITDREWMNLPRASMVHEAMRIDPVRNRIEGNTTFQEHIAYLFQHILGDQTFVSPETKISILGVEYVGSEAVSYLGRNWTSWSQRISSITLFTPQHSIDEIVSTILDGRSDAESSAVAFRNFISTRARAYILSSEPIDQPLAGRERFGSNVYSSGESLYDENVIIRAWPAVLDWVELCYKYPEREEPEHYIPNTDVEESKENDDSSGSKKQNSTPKKRFKSAEVRDMDVSELRDGLAGLHTDQASSETH